jgi:hypothetical protein
VASCWIFYTNYTMMHGSTNIRSLSSCCCSMLVPIDALKQFDASFSDPTPLSQLQNQHVPLLRLRLRLHKYLTGALFPKFNRMVELSFWPRECSNSKIFSASWGTNLSAWLSILGLGTTDVCAELRKTKRANWGMTFWRSQVRASSYDSNNQPTRCNNPTSLLLDVYVWLNMFRASPPHHQERTTALGASGFIVGGKRLERCWSWSGRFLDHEQQRSSRFPPKVKPEAPSAVVCSWWWAGRRPKHVEPHINVK